MIRRRQHGAGRESGPSLRLPPGGLRGRDLVEVLDTLCRSRSAPVRTVLLHFDAGPESLPRLLELGYWTLLSGADDAAIVAGYRLLKLLLDADERVARARVGLMVVGSDPSAGQNALSKLRAAVAAGLHAPLELLGHQQRMTPARCRTLGSFAVDDEVWPRLSEWLSDLQPPEVEEQADGGQAVPAGEADDLSHAMAEDAADYDMGDGEATDDVDGWNNSDGPADAHNPDHDRRAPLPPRRRVAAPLAPSTLSAAVATPPRPAPGMKLPPLHQPVAVPSSTAPPLSTTTPPASLESHENPGPAPSSAAPRAAAGPTQMHRQGSEVASLFDLIDSDPRTTASIPGGLPLEARCPRQPETQLAVDAAGRLHLLHRHDSAEGDPPTPREAILELVAVRDWARQHRQLLQLTEPARHFDLERDPVLHLFTDRADLAVGLVARLGDLVKLHLLREVALGDQHTFFCTPLSA